jgi:hypothetical protein
MYIDLKYTLVFPDSGGECGLEKLFHRLLPFPLILRSRALHKKMYF